MTRRTMTLDRLLEAAGLEAVREKASRNEPAGGWPRVRGVTMDSRRVRPGDLFVATVGERFDGRRFVPAAVEAGAVAVLGPAASEDSRSSVSVPWIDLAEPRRAIAPLARALYGDPAERLRLLGVTGTNGKSSLVTLLASMLEAAGEPTATLGTLGYGFAGRALDGGGRTTPEAPDLYRLLAEVADAGARAAALEVSSHALELGRVEGLRFALAAFTNLSRDHLDFHGDLESYFAAKKKLFSLLEPGGVAVVTLEDTAPWGHRLAEELRRELGADHRVLTCGEVEEAEVRPLSARLDLDGIDLHLVAPTGEIHLRSTLVGRFQLWNLITAAACGVALGLEIDAIERGLGAVEAIPGRLERVPGALPALVDYSHTPGALEAALAAVRELTDRPIVVVFGCGGERDRGKRPDMGRAAGRLADLPILTSDNPRREDPLRIIADAEEGLRGHGEYLVEPDRGRAIELAVERARELGALVLVAGRGHETLQDLGDEIRPFDDRLELAKALSSFEKPLRGPGTPGRSLDVATEVHHG